MGDRVIGIIMGGESIESKFSLKVGNLVADSLEKQGYNYICIDVKSNLIDLVNKKIDFAFIVLYGCPGQDGSIQGLLEMLEIPYTGSDIYACSIAKNKPISKILFESNNLSVPKWFTFSKDDIHDLDEIRRKATNEIGYPLVIKPATLGGLSLGISIVYEKEKFGESLVEAFKYDNKIIVEKYIDGLDFSTGIISYKNTPTLRPILNDYNKKMQTHLVSDLTNRKTITYDIDSSVIDLVIDSAKKAFDAVGGKGLGYVDSIYSYSEKKIYIIEVGLVAGLSKNSNIPLAAKEAGLTYDDVINICLLDGLERNNLNQNDFKK